MCMKLHVDTEGMSTGRKLWAWRVWPFLALVWLYKKLLSPVLPSACRYHPTCSEYTFDAIKQRGVIQGIIIGGLRLLRCAPWGSSGYDPVEAFAWPWEKKASRQSAVGSPQQPQDSAKP